MVSQLEKSDVENSPLLEVGSKDDDNQYVTSSIQADLIVDCAPMFEERFAMNREAIAQKKPLVECAMNELEAQLTTIIPGKTPCLRCIFPESPSTWKRQFPVFGAVSGSVGCLGAMEAV